MAECADLLDAMRQAGLAPTGDLPDSGGHLVRYRVNGDKSGSKNGWLILHEDGPIPVASFGSWRTGQAHTWRGSGGRSFTAAEVAALRYKEQAMRQAREHERRTVQASAQAKASELWRIARPATNAHPYLVKKRVPAYGIRQLRGSLLVPLRDVDGALHSLQFIDPNGVKRFLTGGRVAGCYFAIGRPVDQLLLGEGLATCSTLYQATGNAVAVCFNCGNLEPVAKALRRKFPRLRLVVCADNDSDTPGNPGVSHARSAARAVGGLLAVPQFKCQAKGGVAS